MGVMIQVATFAVKYKGHPFNWSIPENKPLVCFWLPWASQLSPADLMELSLKEAFLLLTDDISLIIEDRTGLECSRSRIPLIAIHRRHSDGAADPKQTLEINKKSWTHQQWSN
ncbi:hypothetical protein H5410_011451 [Solanum commersonii]|uniref:Uncharacterized protein n=1 Tax=Solanum commersonii TaxID=4109 RepID=A0A9J6APH3_SOLCO|nr:hypothetical protein H5410_011451 [Solanum commersonii]